MQYFIATEQCSYTRTSCMGSLNCLLFPSTRFEDVLMKSLEDSAILFEILRWIYPKFRFLGSFFNWYDNIAACSVTNDAAQTVAKPNKDGTTWVPVEIPIAFWTAVDAARVVPKATHPPTTGATTSGMQSHRLPNEKSGDFWSLLSPSLIAPSDCIQFSFAAKEKSKYVQRVLWKLGCRSRGASNNETMGCHRRFFSCANRKSNRISFCHFQKNSKK